MRYTKPALTFEQQADLLLARGMKGDRTSMISRLAVVNYYRMSGYWHPFRDAGSHVFRANTSFDVVWERYVFDRQLRLLVIDAIERIEVAVRTQLAYHLAHQSGDAFAYATDPTLLPHLTPEDRSRLFATLREDVDHSKETFAEHFRGKYGDVHEHMPVWMACELMTFGCVLKLYRGARPDVKRCTAKVFGVHDNVFGSWLLALNTIRNICAHHGRLWNRELGTKPMIPSRSPEWHHPVQVPNDRMFSILTICQYCLARIAPQSGWRTRFRALLQTHPYVPRGSMGIPKDWECCPIWSEPPET